MAHCLTSIPKAAISAHRGKAKSHALGADFHDYSLDLDLFGAVDPKASKISATARHVVLVIAKEAGSEGFWPRLTKDNSKHPYIKVCCPLAL